MAFCVEKKNLPEIGDIVTEVIIDDINSYKTACDIMFKSGKKVICHIVNHEVEPEKIQCHFK